MEGEHEVRLDFRYTPIEHPRETLAAKVSRFASVVEERTRKKVKVPVHVLAANEHEVAAREKLLARLEN